MQFLKYLEKAIGHLSINLSLTYLRILEIAYRIKSFIFQKINL